MEKVLDVYLYDRLAGQYIQTESGLAEFIYDGTYLSALSAVPLSQSLPLRKERFTGTECRGFFAGILPEGEKRKIIAANLGISAGNDFSMLHLIGGECAGAVTFMSPGHQPGSVESTYRDLTEQELLAILDELPKRPLLAGKEGIRLSLAGAQDKLAVYISEETISLPIGIAPSTHILKPVIGRYKDTVENEAFCMQLALQMGLNVASVHVRKVGGRAVLLIERYDRMKANDPTVPLQRLHQEDFCQALGIAPEKKYEEEGGVSVKQCFDLLRKVSSAPLIDLRNMLDAVIFNFLIGNHDAHGKNFSLLYRRSPNGYVVRLAPLYDLICTMAYPDLSRNMAMSIGGKYKSESVTAEHFDRMAGEAGLARPLVRPRIKTMAEAILKNTDSTNVTSPFVEIIRDNARKTKAMF